MTNHVRKLIKSHGSICQLQATESNGLPAYYFVAIKPEKKLLFEKVIQDGGFDIAEYAEILLSGYGLPGDEQKKYMLTQFDFEVQEAA